MFTFPATADQKATQAVPDENIPQDVTEDDTSNKLKLRQEDLENHCKDGEHWLRIGKAVYDVSSLDEVFYLMQNWFLCVRLALYRLVSSLDGLTSLNFAVELVVESGDLKTDLTNVSLQGWHLLRLFCSGLFCQLTFQVHWSTLHASIVVYCYGGRWVKLSTFSCAFVVTLD